MTTPPVRPDAYGEAFADVYDEWYSDVTDAEATADFVAARATTGPVIELGVGTGRLAIPLVHRGLPVIGVDASASMLARCAQRRLGHRLLLVRADMTRLPLRPKATVALIAFNTLFNVTTAAGQQQVFDQLRQVLTPDGLVIVEAVDLNGLADAPPTSIGVRSVRHNGLTVVGTALDAPRQQLGGRHIDVSDSGIDIRSWFLRWATRPEIDGFASRAGFELIERYGNWDQRPSADSDDRHISVYRARPRR